MTNVLSALERDIIIALLSGEHIMLHVLCRPTGGTPVTFSAETGFGGVEVSSQGTITLKKPNPGMEAFIGQNVTVAFYFRKLGLSFASPLTRGSAGLEMIVPLDITRLPESLGNAGSRITAKLFFSISGKTDISISCVGERDFPLFQAETWLAIPGGLAPTVGSYLHQLVGAEVCQLPVGITGALKKDPRLLYIPEGRLPEKQPFQFDSCVLDRDWSGPENARLRTELTGLTHSLYMPLEAPKEGTCGWAVGFGDRATGQQFEQEKVEELLFVTAAANYLLAPQADGLPAAPKTLTIVFVSDKVIVLGGSSASFPLEKDKEYALQITCPAGQLSRSVYTTGVVSHVYSIDTTGKSCGICRFTNLKAEDTRFLFEKLYGALFQQPSSPRSLRELNPSFEIENLTS